jgi:prepilin-type N-terminal cleavage/methylation domain-containing protein
VGTDVNEKLTNWRYAPRVDSRVEVVNKQTTMQAGNANHRARAARGEKGFTLIEMAVVLTIIALIIGGVIVGQDLIRVSQLKGVTTEVARYTQATIDFRDKYLALPGDFAGAEALWGTASGGCPWGTGTGTQTCNGNGNGHIEGDWSGVWYEDYRAWQHLANAGMIDGQYTGVSAGPGAGGDPVAHIPGVNAPASKLPGAGYNWNSSYGWRYGGSFEWNGGPPGQYLEFGGPFSWGDDLENAVLTTQEACNIDTKMDDGLPGTGNITTFQPSSGYNANCASTSDASTARYNLAYTGVACNLFIRMPF